MRDPGRPPSTEALIARAVQCLRYIFETYEYAEKYRHLCEQRNRLDARIKAHVGLIHDKRLVQELSRPQRPKRGAPSAADRGGGIAWAVEEIRRASTLKPTRGQVTRDRVDGSLIERPSACSIVCAALHQLDMNPPTERTVERLWAKHKGQPIRIA